MRAAAAEIIAEAPHPRKATLTTPSRLVLQEATACCDVGKIESGRNLKRLARQDGQGHRQPFKPATRIQACL